MKALMYIGTFDTDMLRMQLLERFPEWRVEDLSGAVVEYFSIDYQLDTSLLTLTVPDDADETAVAEVIDNHDPTAQLFDPLTWDEILASRLAFMQLPNWATWTPAEAQDFILQDVLSGMSKTDIETWVESNVTSLATAKTALKLVGGELVDLREIVQKLAYAVIILRDVAIRRRLN